MPESTQEIGVLKVPKDLARKAQILAKLNDQTFKDWANTRFRELIESEYDSQIGKPKQKSKVGA